MVNKITSPITPLGEIDKINEIIDDKQENLVSGINIKTINNTSLLGSGNIDIQGGGTVDQTYDSTSTNAQSGVAIEGARFLQNTATGPYSLTINGVAGDAVAATNIGEVATADTSGTAIGYHAGAGTSASALGSNANANGSYSIQLGYGTNSTASTLSVGFNAASFVDRKNWQLLDGTTGLIPYQRIDSITDNNAGGQLKTWTGTKAQYDAIVTKDTNTLYNITDDDTYIGDIATDLNGKMDKDGLNCTCPMVVSRTPNNQGGVVEIWSDGYCIQTGISSNTGSWGVTTINLDKSYIDTNYIISVAGYTVPVDFSNANSVLIRGASRALYTNKTVSSFGVQSNNDVNWRTEGYIR